MVSRAQSLLILHGVGVLLLGLAGGCVFLYVILGVDIPGDYRAWKQIHLEGILNSLLLFAVAGFVERLNLVETRKCLLAWTLATAAWCNTVGSLIGPFFGVRGLSFDPPLANGVVFFIFLIAGAAIAVALWLMVTGALQKKSD